MNKQEEIQDWINRYLTEQFIGTFTSLEHFLKHRFGSGDECLNEAKKILQYLHSQGVVIKVGRELPYIPFPKETPAHKGCLEGMKIMIRAGYVAVGPLVKGK